MKYFFILIIAFLPMFAFAQAYVFVGGDSIKDTIIQHKHRLKLSDVVGFDEKTKRIVKADTLSHRPIGIVIKVFNDSSFVIILQGSIPAGVFERPKFTLTSKP